MRTAQRWVLPKRPTSPARACRRLATAGLGLPRELLHTAQLLTSELVTNAVKYGGALIVLTVRDEHELLRVVVYDDGPRHPHLGAGASQDEGGRGLLLVDSLAHAWGTSDGAASLPGKSVWFTLRKTS
jgi:anti-sigma regulatory factor (Ser/Thr protein kinase)